MHRNRLFAFVIFLSGVLLLAILDDALEGLTYGITVGITSFLVAAVFAYFLSFSLQAFERAFLAWTGKKVLARVCAYLAGGIALSAIAVVFITTSLPALIRDLDFLKESIAKIQESDALSSWQRGAFMAAKGDVMRTLSLFSSYGDNLGYDTGALALLTAVICLALLLMKNGIFQSAQGLFNGVRTEQRERIFAAFSGADALFREYFNARVMFGSILGGAIYVLFAWTDQPCPVLFSTLTGTFAICPYFGALLPLFGAIILGFIGTGTLQIGVLAIGLVAIVLFEIAIRFVAPTKLNISFFTVLIGAILGSISAGIIGILVFPMLFSVGAHLGRMWIKYSSDRAIKNK